MGKQPASWENTPFAEAELVLYESHLRPDSRQYGLCGQMPLPQK